MHEVIRINSRGNLNGKIEWRINTIDRLGTKLNAREEECLRKEEFKIKKERDSKLELLRVHMDQAAPSFSLPAVKKKSIKIKPGENNTKKSNKIYFNFRDLFVVEGPTTHLVRPEAAREEIGERKERLKKVQTVRATQRRRKQRK